MEVAVMVIAALAFSAVTIFACLNVASNVDDEMDYD